MSEPDETLLAAKAADGDLRAFDVLIRRYQLRIFRLCLGILGNRNDAEDAAQDTFLSAWRAIGRFRGEAKFSTWLYRLATNRCLTLLARRSPPTGDLPEQPGHLGDPEAEFEARQRIQGTVAAIGRLTPEQRLPFVLYELEGLTYNEIAEVLGVSMSAVKSRINRARVELAHALDDDP